MAPKEKQLGILVPYLERVTKYGKGKEPELPITTQGKVLVHRYLWNWIEEEHYNRKGLTPKGAFLYYKELTK